LAIDRKPETSRPKETAEVEKSLEANRETGALLGQGQWVSW